MKKLLTIAAILLLPHAAGGQVLDKDPRTSDNEIWRRNPWVVQSLNPGCTGTFVSPNIILTAAHCACQPNRVCHGQLSFMAYQNGAGAIANAGRQITAQRITQPVIPFSDSSGDWVLFRTINYNHPKEWVAPVSTTRASYITTGYRSIGYGMMRIIQDRELPQLKDRHIDFLCLYRGAYTSAYELQYYSIRVCESKIPGYASAFGQSGRGIQAHPKAVAQRLQTGYSDSFPIQMVVDWINTNNMVFTLVGFNSYLQYTNPHSYNSNQGVYSSEIKVLLGDESRLKESFCGVTATSGFSSGVLGYGTVTPSQFFQSSCRLVGGNSGGPLLDQNNRVSGVASSSGGFDSMYQRVDVIAARVNEAIAANSVPDFERRPREQPTEDGSGCQTWASGLSASVRLRNDGVCEYIYTDNGRAVWDTAIKDNSCCRTRGGTIDCPARLGELFNSVVMPECDRMRSGGGEGDDEVRRCRAWADTISQQFNPGQCEVSASVNAVCYRIDQAYIDRKIAEARADCRNRERQQGGGGTGWGDWGRQGEGGNGGFGGQTYPADCATACTHPDPGERWRRWLSCAPQIGGEYVSNKLGYLVGPFVNGFGRADWCGNIFAR